ncbi:hypothetical protein SALBM311S_05337 [Streptomyces alboniger]
MVADVGGHHQIKAADPARGRPRSGALVADQRPPGADVCRQVNAAGPPNAARRAPTSVTSPHSDGNSPTRPATHHGANSTARRRRKQANQHPQDAELATGGQVASRWHRSEPITVRTPTHLLAAPSRRTHCLPPEQVPPPASSFAAHPRPVTHQRQLADTTPPYHPPAHPRFLKFSLSSLVFRLCLSLCPCLCPSSLSSLSLTHSHSPPLSSSSTSTTLNLCSPHPL